MQTILVTGCAGFIGSHLCEELLAQDFKVVGVDNFDAFYAKEVKQQNLNDFAQHPNFEFLELDLSLSDNLHKLSNKNISAVIHLAAKVGVLPSLKDPKDYINANIVSTNNLLNFIVKEGIKKLLFASSSSVYGNNKKIPFAEGDTVDHPISPYAVTKRAGELFTYNYHHLYNLDVINLRFFTVYGPKQRPDLAIHKFFNRIAQDQEIEMYGDGSSARDYTYVKDITWGIKAALRYLLVNEAVFETINLGNSKPVPLSTLIDAVYAVNGKDKNVLVKDMQAGDVNITFADISKAQQILGYEPKTSLEEGLRNFKKWYDQSKK